ncbi:MAG TPA: ArsC/Spx/MgsR family protein, partial [Paracoccus sp. (in: a-proteobacteria)]|nr:ArsC/Spx/MgsR family protein [Paracoccus sp. (in: a-proteobacteria)]
PRQALRVKGTDAAERGLPGADDETILAGMVENPVLVERPIVCGPGGVRLCRPVELVVETFAR